MNWKIAQAKQRFAELIKAATQEPQLIYHQEQLVAAVVKAELFQEFLAWRERCEKPSIADVFSELRQLALRGRLHLGNFLAPRSP